MLEIRLLRVHPERQFTLPDGTRGVWSTVRAPKPGGRRRRKPAPPPPHRLCIVLPGTPFELVVGWGRPRVTG